MQLQAIVYTTKVSKLAAAKIFKQIIFFALDKMWISWSRISIRNFSSPEESMPDRWFLGRCCWWDPRIWKPLCSLLRLIKTHKTLWLAGLHNPWEAHSVARLEAVAGAQGGFDEHFHLILAHLRPYAKVKATVEPASQRNSKWLGQNPRTRWTSQKLLK